jgi:transposase-like protein
MQKRKAERRSTRENNRVSNSMRPIIRRITSKTLRFRSQKMAPARTCDLILFYSFNSGGASHCSLILKKDAPSLRQLQTTNL